MTQSFNGGLGCKIAAGPWNRTIRKLAKATHAANISRNGPFGASRTHALQLSDCGLSDSIDHGVGAREL